MPYTIPLPVKQTVSRLIENGYEAYPVGGCVRDVLIRTDPKDWDVATNARPETIQKLFQDSVYENEFGTVAVKTKSDDPALKIIEVTTFRTEQRYTDKRHPDEVKFADSIKKDLARRDFTVNAMALDIEKNTIIDPYDGQQDIENKLVRAVGDPNERFDEDALRLVRGVRFATELGFEIEPKTKTAIAEHAALLRAIAKERVHDEFVKIIMANRAADGVRLLEKVGLLQYIIPELHEGIGCSQNKHHTYTVWEHNVRSLAYAAEQNYSLLIRLAALLHDVGKPRTKEGEGETATFYGHEIVGARMTAAILDRLRFPKEIIERVTHLVRYHLFYYNVGEVTEAGVRRFLYRVGPEYIPDLIKVREADRIGSGVPKAVPYKLRHLLFMIEKVQRDPISTEMLAVDGNDIMKITNIKPGPRVGMLLDALLEEVLDDPKKNNRSRLEKRIEELHKLSDEELKKLARESQKKQEAFEEEAEGELKKKYWVK